MKTICSTLVVIIICTYASIAKIRNGYSPGITSASTSLKMLIDLLNDDQKLTLSEKRVLEKRIKEVTDFILYYELTEQLLIRFRTIAPDIYNSIDSLRDGKGRPTDVYIRFISESHARVMAWGITNIAPMMDDPHGYRSEFGDYTVSVKVWAVEKSLMVLAHELGHVKYQVDNLASYYDYYKTKYPRATTDPNNIGHAFGDASGDCAVDFEKRFRASHFRYWKRGGGMESAGSLKERISEEIRRSMLTRSANM